MATVTIDGEEYTVYGDVDEADVYLGGSVTADAWRAADADTKARSLVSSTRWIDSQKWVPDYDTFDERAANPAFVNASFELASLLAGDPDYRTSYSNAGQKRIKAGSVEIENFRGASVQVTTPFPSTVMLLIGQYLEGAGTALGGARSFGTCRPTKLDRGWGFGGGL